VLHATFQPLARQHKVVAAGEAAYAYVRAKSFNTPLKATARVLLAQRDNIAQSKRRYHPLPMASNMALKASRAFNASRRAASAKSALFDA